MSTVSNNAREMSPILNFVIQYSLIYCPEQVIVLLTSTTLTERDIYNWLLTFQLMLGLFG